MDDGKERSNTCGKCKWFNLEPGLLVKPVGERPGACHRYPPVVVVIDRRMKIMHPSVPEFFWCGEFTPQVRVSKS